MIFACSYGNNGILAAANFSSVSQKDCICAPAAVHDVVMSLVVDVCRQAHNVIKSLQSDIFCKDELVLSANDAASAPGGTNE